MSATPAMELADRSARGNSRALRRRIASVVAIALEGHLASLDIPSLGEIERWVSVTGNAKFLADQIAYMAELNVGEERVAQR